MKTAEDYFQEIVQENDQLSVREQLDLYMGIAGLLHDITTTLLEKIPEL